LSAPDSGSRAPYCAIEAATHLRIVSQVRVVTSCPNTFSINDRIARHDSQIPLIDKENSVNALVPDAGIEGGAGYADPATLPFKASGFTATTK